MISTKAAATMHYIHLKGSPTQRRALRDEKVKAFAEDMEKAFEGKAFLTKKELKKLVQKHTQGLSVKVRHFPQWLATMSNAGACTTKRWIFFNRGLDILLPFEKRKGFGAVIENEAYEKEALKHEMNHVFTTATIPNVLRFFSKRFRDTNVKAAKLYIQKLYTDHDDIINADDLKSEISLAKVFTPKMRPSDKVEVFQKWRHNLMDERDAFKNGTDHYRQDDLLSRDHCKDQREWIQEFNFDDKIKFIKELILEERAKQVASHKSISQHQPSSL